MSGTKIGILVGYAVLIALVVLGSGIAASIALWLLVLLAVAHVVEMAVFYGRCKAAGGSMPGHMLQVFLFGVFHVRELKSGA